MTEATDLDSASYLHIFMIFLYLESDMLLATYIVIFCCWAVIRFTTRGSFHWYELTLVPPRINNHMSGKVWNENTYPLLNFNGCNVKVVNE